MARRIGLDDGVNATLEYSQSRRIDITFDEEQLEIIIRRWLERATATPEGWDRQEVRIEFNQGQVLRCDVTIIETKDEGDCT